MKNKVPSLLGQCVRASVTFMIICGLAYPLFLTGVSGAIFPDKSKGSLVKVGNKTVASEMVGQEFTQDKYLWGRPSAYHYNVYVEKEGEKYYRDGEEFQGLSSGSHNYAPSNPALKDRVAGDVERFLKRNPGIKKEDIPADLLTESGSGLDPNISPKAADIQVDRISKASGISKAEVRKIIKKNTEGKLLGVFGNERVNVLGVNLDIYRNLLKR